MPEEEQLKILGQLRATLAIHLSIRNLTYVRDTLVPFYGEDCPVIIAYRSTWSDEKHIETTLVEMAQKEQTKKITRTPLIFVGKDFVQNDFTASSLYERGFSHILRNKGKKKDRPAEAGN